MLFFTADTHFYDDNNNRRSYRYFKNARQMNLLIVKNWNKTVKAADTVYHLGDFVSFTDFFKPQSYKIVKKLNGKIKLIMGNNEKNIMNKYFGGNFETYKNFLLSCGFDEIIEKGIYLTVGDIPCYLNHFPAKSDPQVFNLFGHVHILRKVYEFGFNVGVDCFKFFPVPAKVVKKYYDLIIGKRFDENVFFTIDDLRNS